MNEVFNLICGDFALGMSVLEAVISGDGLQVVRVSTDDLRSSLRIMLPPSCDVSIKNSQRFHISHYRHFQRLYRPSCPLAEVRGRTSPVEEGAVESGMARLRVLLRGDAQQRPLNTHFQPIKRLVGSRVVGKIIPS
jgi:hypothetical protein